MRGIYRIIDVCLNRITEGLRTVEDLLRFHYEKPLWLDVKKLRLDAGMLAEHFPANYLMGSRDAEADPGLDSSIGRELHRRSELEIIRASISRVKEALRTLEECSKIVAPGEGVIGSIKEIRTRLYGIEKDLLLMFQREWLESMSLYFIADYGLLGEKIMAVVEEAIEGGVDVVQLRVKGASDREFLSLAEEIRAITRRKKVPLIIDDRADIAVAVSADGVHVGQGDMPPSTIRRLYGSTLAVGMSVHNMDELRVAKKEGADYIGIGPVFTSETKGVYIPPLGVKGAAAIAEEWGGPYVVIGGVGPDNISEIVEGNLRAVAVIGAIANCDNPRAAAEKLRVWLERWKSDDNG